MRTIFFPIFFIGAFSTFFLLKSPSNRSGTVSGFVKDESGNPLCGASVAVRGKNTWTVTSATGYYDLELPPGKYIIIISFVEHLTRLSYINVTAGADIIRNFISPQFYKQCGEVVITSSRLRKGKEFITTLPRDEIRIKKPIFAMTSEKK